MEEDGSNHAHHRHGSRTTVPPMNQNAARDSENEDLLRQLNNATSNNRHHPVSRSSSPGIIEGGIQSYQYDSKNASLKLRDFPPEANAAYDLSPDHISEHGSMREAQRLLGHSVVTPRVRSGNSLWMRGSHPQYADSSKRPPTDGVAKLLAKAYMGKDNMEAGMEVDLRSKGEKLADTIDFSRKGWITEIPGASGIICSAEDQRKDFIGEIDEGAELEYCTKCKKKHIPPGSPLTLQDRDTCGSYLPEWFPTDKITNPWDAYTGLLNEYVKLQEISQGYNHRQNPDRKPWDLKFHEPDDKWREVGRKSGWWKCRSGLDAPICEALCNLCHYDAWRRGARGELGPQQKSVAERKADIMAFIEKRMRIVGEKDKAIALAQIRAEGLPQHLGIVKCPAHIIPSIPHPDAPPIPFDHYVKSSTSDNPTEECFVQNRSRRKPLEF